VRAARPRPFRCSFLDEMPAAVSAVSHAAAEAQHAIAQARSCSASLCNISCLLPAEQVALKNRERTTQWQ